MTSQLGFDLLVAKLQLKPHPEGGFYRETYRAQGDAEFREHGRRVAGTSIYFLMPRGDVSRFHRLASDEIWHFYQGDSITVVMITTEGRIVKKTVGPVGAGDAQPQVVIPENTWFGAIHEGPVSNGYTLVGCTVSPGFEFKDFELASRSQLLSTFAGASPETREWISKLTQD
jgi:predicted cupin superfamily sugar epimerase